MARKDARAKPTLAQQKSQRKALKRLGIFSDRVDLRKPMTGYQKSQVKKYAYVIDNPNFAVVKTRSAEDAKHYKGLKRKGRTVIVPKFADEKATLITKTVKQKGKRPKKSTYISIKRPTYGGIKRRLGAGFDEIPKGYKRVYSIDFMRGSRRERITFGSMEEMSAFMAEYEKNRYPNWREHVYQELWPYEHDEEEDEDEDI